MLVMTLKKHRKAMKGLHPISKFIFRPGREEHFGFKWCGAHIAMPASHLIGDDYATHRACEPMTSLFRSSLVIKHPAPDSVYQTSQVHRDSQMSNLCTLQERFFHSPFEQTDNNPIQKTIYDVYPNDYLIVTPLAFASLEEHGMFERLLSCLKNAFWILHGEADFDHDVSQYSVLSKEYMNAYKAFREFRGDDQVVFLAQWKEEEKEHALFRRPVRMITHHARHPARPFSLEEIGG